MIRKIAVAGMFLAVLGSQSVWAGCGCGMSSCGGGGPTYTIPSSVDWGADLRLDDVQKKQLDRVLRAQGARVSKFQQQRSALLGQLGDVTKSDQPDLGRVHELQKKIGKLQKAMERTRYDLWEEATFLTPAQRAKFVLNSANAWPMEDLMASMRSAENW